MFVIDDLLMFLRACLDDDERVARAAGEPPYEWVAEVDPEFGGPPYVYQLGISASPSQAPGHVDPERVAHILRWDPARVLALTAALKAILDEFSYEAGELRAVLTLGEALYADREGYREEWRP